MHKFQALYFFGKKNKPGYFLFSWFVLILMFFLSMSKEIGFQHFEKSIYMLISTNGKYPTSVAFCSERNINDDIETVCSKFWHERKVIQHSKGLWWINKICRWTMCVSNTFLTRWLLWVSFFFQKAKVRRRRMKDGGWITSGLLTSCQIWLVYNSSSLKRAL